MSMADFAKSFQNREASFHVAIAVRVQADFVERLFESSCPLHIFAIG